MFYIGTVENNNDPLKLGRLQIRILGLHTHNRQKLSEDVEHYLPTDDLPWAIPVIPMASSIDGIGDFNVIQNGSKVIVFFMDKNLQQPFYIGSIPFNLEHLPDFDYGFSDPTKQHPKESYLNENSISRLVRNEKINETCIGVQNNDLRKWTVNDIDYEEPESAYNAEYPYNRVIQTESGIVIELDSTPNHNRIHIFHPSGSYVEIREDGTKVEKIKGVDIQIDEKDKTVVIGGNFSVKLNNSNIEVAGDTVLTNKGAMTLNAEGDITLNVESETGIGIQTDKKLNVMANEVNISSPNINITSESQNPNITIKNSATITALSSITVTSTGSTSITSDSSVIVQAPSIQLN